MYTQSNRNYSITVMPSKERWGVVVGKSARIPGAAGVKAHLHVVLEEVLMNLEVVWWDLDGLHADILEHSRVQTSVPLG